LVSVESELETPVWFIATDKLRGMEVEERCDPYDPDCSNKLDYGASHGGPNVQSTSTSYNHQQHPEGSGGIRESDRNLA
jgi:hypothetical protein